MVKMRAATLRRYGTRRLKSGEEFEASRQDARILNALGRAEYVAASAKGSRERDETAELRDEYERVVGKRPWNGWDAETLREKMAEARGTYSRRDMRAED